MKPIKILALVLILLGALSLFYQGFNYTSSSTKAEIGSVELSVKDTKQVDLPGWLGWILVVSGCALLLIPRRP
jgi:TRAP-type C4-dicarboxylate transport system permease small subunit